ncbi:MAG TPA: hypothetical protein VG328_10295 [Stellaceae bacterium]|jgi:hypothetical protein|nr:hypothetical protein [Stellaceae bacterium]
MRSLLKLFAIGAVIVFLAIHRTDITDKLSAFWAEISPAGMQRPVGQSVQQTGAAVTGLMDGVGHAFGR